MGSEGRESESQVILVRRLRAALATESLHAGDRVAIMLPTSRDFFVAFFAVLFCGAVPVPIYPPFRLAQIEDHLRRQAGILSNAEASALITNAEIRVVGNLLYGLVSALQHIVTIPDLTDAAPIAAPLPAAPDAVALIQYTSGSTGDPKGVVLSHANLLANIRAMGAVLKASSADRVVSWLPLYHDMGLIGCVFPAINGPRELSLIPPELFLSRPGVWLRTISRAKATVSPAPNFAYGLCADRVRDEELVGVDLSSWRMALNGAEPIFDDLSDSEVVTSDIEDIPVMPAKKKKRTRIVVNEDEPGVDIIKPKKKRSDTSTTKR